MTWTTEKPTVPGWYWWRYEKGRKATMLNVSQSHIQQMDIFTEGSLVMFLNEVPGHWAGPIPAPEEG